MAIQPNDRLKEEKWAAKTGLGRMAIREALTRLHGEGLVTRGPKGGFFAAGMAETDVREIRQVREILEVAAVELAAEKITPEQIVELETACDDFAYMVGKGYEVGACDADRRFHRLLMAAGGNARLIRAYEASHIPLFHLRIGRSREYIADYERTDQEHRAIVAALRRGDRGDAAKQIRAHVARGANLVLSEAPAAG